MNENNQGMLSGKMRQNIIKVIFIESQDIMKGPMFISYKSTQEQLNVWVPYYRLIHCIWDTTLVVSGIFGNNSINTGNISKYFTESCAQGPNNKFFFNLSIQS